MKRFRWELSMNVVIGRFNFKINEISLFYQFYLFIPKTGLPKTGIILSLWGNIRVLLDLEGMQKMDTILGTASGDNEWSNYEMHSYFFGIFLVQTWSLIRRTIGFWSLKLRR